MSPDPVFRLMIGVEYRQLETCAKQHPSLPAKLTPLVLQGKLSFQLGLHLETCQRRFPEISILPFLRLLLHIVARGSSL